MHPAIDAIEADDAADAALLESIADWCLRYTPLVACDAPDGLLLDISGCAHLYGGEDALVADLSGRLEAAGFAYRVAIAGSIGAAWAAAHYGEPGNYPCGDERKLLAPLPLAALRLDGGTVAALARVGLKRIGDIVDLPRAPLTARFGAELLRQLDRALGQEHEPLTPRLPVAPYVAEQRFAEPIAREEDVLGSVARLAGRLQVALERRGDGARRHRAHIIPHRRRAAPHRRRHARGRCAIRTTSARCLSSGWRRWPTRSIPASASTWRGCRCWWRSPARPSRSASAARRMRPSSTGWSIA